MPNALNYELHIRPHWPRHILMSCISLLCAAPRTTAAIDGPALRLSRSPLCPPLAVWMVLVTPSAPPPVTSTTHGSPRPWPTTASGPPRSTPWTLTRPSTWPPSRTSPRCSMRSRSSPRWTLAWCPRSMPTMLPGVRAVSIEQGLLDFFERQRNSAKLIPWVLSKIDDTPRVEKGAFVVFGGYSSTGKTAFSLSLAWNQGGALYECFPPQELNGNKI